MNKDEFDGEWKQWKGKIKEQWGKLTDSDMTEIGGKKDQFLGKLQSYYGYTKEQAQKAYDDFRQRFGQNKPKP